jgi:hypothetical protein
MNTSTHTNTHTQKYAVHNAWKLQNENHKHYQRAVNYLTETYPRAQYTNSK